MLNKYLGLFNFLKLGKAIFVWHKVDMKYLVVIVAFFIGLSFAMGQDIDPNGYNKFYYPNGQLSSEGTMKDGQPDGYWKTYYENGNLKSVGNRVDFKLDGSWKFYNESGSIVQDITYRDGKKNGAKKSYNEEKVLIKEVIYKDDIKHGPAKTYYPSGKLHEEYVYEEGREQGIGYEYSEEDRRIITIITYRNGYVNKKQEINRRDKFNQKQGLWIEFYDNMKPKWEGKFRNDKRNGYFKEYSEDGDLLSTTKWKDGIQVEDPEELVKLDIKTQYYPSAKPKFVGSYNKDIPEGVHRFYSEDGEITSSKIYRKGILMGEGIVDAEGNRQGNWKEYHDTGELKSEGEYKDGKRVGPWKFYHKNGQAEQLGSYIGGQPDGEWKWYYPNGVLRREENYYKGNEDGPSVEYSDTSKVIAQGEYVDGLREGFWFFDVGDHREEGSYRDGQMHGDWKFINDLGVVVFEGNFVDGQPDGRHTFYYHSGKLKERGKYIIGKKQGDWTKYFEDGSIMQTITFEDGVEVAIDGVKIPSSEQ